MQNTKLVKLLKTFSKDELRDFDKFLHSPFHNGRKETIKYFKAVKRYHPDFKHLNFNKEILFEKMYPREKYNDNVIRNLNSYLFNLGKKYLAFSYFKESKFFYEYHLLCSLDEHNSDTIFENEFEKANDMVNSENFNEDYFLHKWLMGERIIDFNLVRNRDKMTCGDFIKNSENQIYCLLIRVIRHYNDMVVNKQSYNYDFNDTATDLFIKNFNFEEFFIKLKTDDEHYDYLMYNYYLFMSCYHHENENYYTKMKEYAFKNIDKLDKTEIEDRYIDLYTYSVKKVFGGNSKFLRECFYLNKDALEKKTRLAFFNNGIISLGFFRNYITIGIANKELDDVETFIKQYKRNLKEDTKDDVLGISYALLHFAKKEYQNAMKCLNKINFTFPNSKRNVKHLYVKIFYETNNYDSLFSLIDTYKHYLNYDLSIPELVKEHDKNFIYYTDHLAKMKSSGDYKGLNALKHDIKVNINLHFTDKSWLVEKAEELK